MSFSDDLDQWMTMLPERIRNEVPIINLAIPGSHDSCSYGICKDAKIAPDAEDIVKSLYRYVPCFVRRWAKTQKYSITEQLSNGIRYFDFRISLNPSNQRLYFVHGLYCEEVSEPFDQIMTFLDMNPKEFLIIDFQHFYYLDTQHHQMLISYFMKLFRRFVYERYLNENNFSRLTLNQAYEMGKQMFVIYRNQTIPPEFFYSYFYPTPWPNVTNITDLKEYLDKKIKLRSPEQGFVRQVVLTPDVKFITPRFYSSLRNACAKKVDNQMKDWLMEQKPGPFNDGDEPCSNVFVADFVDLKNSNFSKIIIDLNMKIEFK